MPHHQPPKPSLFKHRVPIPADPALEAEYRALGWIDCEEGLMWSFARGTPVQPGDHLKEDLWRPQPREIPLLQLLPQVLLHEARDRLPESGFREGEVLVVPLVIEVTFRRMSNNRGRNSSLFWCADEARVIALAAEVPGDQAAKACE